MLTFLFIATSIVWIGIFSWIFISIHRSQVNIQHVITELQQEVKRIEACEKES